MADDAPDVDTLRILIATDTHVGYNEKDKVRGNDALNTFEEVFQICKTQRADFMLHGGDLYHDNKPSRACLFKTMELLRRYSFGPGEVSFQVVSDPSLFSRGMVNFEDRNVNIECPLFMIHGNHDDPGGESNLCVANLLEVAGLVNYFGRAEDLEDIVVKPLLIKKGQTNVAIYGLGNVRDERLHRAFQARKVRFETPNDIENWFHIMILHQNRNKGNKGGVPSKSSIHEEMLPNFLNLVIWGHEHDCEVNPKESLGGEFYVVQPGSSVATALTPGETQMKYLAMIDIRQSQFRCVPKPLLTVRPLVLRDLVLSESGLLKTDTQGIWNALTSEVEAMISQGQDEVKHRKRDLEARGAFPGRPLQVPELPLVRLRVEHSGFETVSGQAFGQQFSGRVANPDEVLLFHRKGGTAGSSGSRKVQSLGDVLEIEEAALDGYEGVKIQDIIYKYIDGGQNLQILPEPDLNDAVQSFVHRAEPCAIEQFVKQAVDATNQAVLRESRAIGEEEIRVQIQDRAEQLRQQRLNAAYLPPAGSSLRGPTSAAELEAKVEDLMTGEEPADALPPTAETRRPEVPFAPTEAQFGGSQASQGRARGGRRGRGASGGRGRGASKRSLEDIEDFAVPEVPPPKIARNQQARASAGGLVDSCPQPARRLPTIFTTGTASSSTAAAARPVPDTPVAGTIPPPSEPLAATPFLSRRGAPTVPSEVLPPEVPGPGIAAASSLRTSTQTASRRQWVLRTPQ